MIKPHHIISIGIAILPLLGCPAQRAGQLPMPAPRDTLPSQVIDDFKLSETQLGRRVWVLTAEEANNYNQRQEVELFRLRIEFYNSTGDSVNAVMTAKKGRINTASRDMEAKDSVVITSRDSLIMITDSIRWDNQDRRLRTESRVRLTRGNDWLSGEGMEASPDLKEIELKRNVRGQKELLDDLSKIR